MTCHFLLVFVFFVDDLALFGCFGIFFDDLQFLGDDLDCLSVVCFNFAVDLHFFVCNILFCQGFALFLSMT